MIMEKLWMNLLGPPSVYTEINCCPSILILASKLLLQKQVMAVCLEDILCWRLLGYNALIHLVSMIRRLSRT